MDASLARREIKYLLDPRSAINLKSKLMKMLPLDANSPMNGYSVRSLYFDTIYDRDYYDKIDGLETRRKIRLRVYGPDDKTAKLEVKLKSGINQWKQSAAIEREDARLVIERRYGELLEKYDAPFLQAVFYKMETDCYMPKIIIEYNRIAFVNHSNLTRITIDSALKSAISSFDIFSDRLPLCPVMCPIILEVKYNRFLLSHIKSALSIVDKTPVSISKYCLCRQAG